MSSQYWHGGAPGLRTGDLIEPRPSGDNRHLIDGCPICEARRKGTPTDYDRDHNFERVYVTIDRFVARVFAAGYPNGALYRVVPIGDLEDDPEDPGRTWAVPAARVLAVVDGYVRLRPGELRKVRRMSGFPQVIDAPNPKAAMDATFRILNRPRSDRMEDRAP